MIRPATAEDAAAVARLHVLGWQAGYRGLLPARFLDAMTVEEHEAWWRQGLPERRVLLAERDGAVAGFVWTGEDAEAPGTGHLVALYVDPARWRSGVGTELLDAAVARFRADGVDSAVLWVLETNAPARHFYEARGWAADGGAEVEHRQDVELHVVRYRLQVGSAG